jgi:hypothetical protein
MTKIEQGQEQDPALIAALDRRAEPRTKTGLSVVVKTSHAHPTEACLLDMSTNGARLRVPEEVAVGASVRIEAPDLLLFGTVRRCCHIDGAHEVGIVLSLPLKMLVELRQLNAAILREGESATSA